MKKSVEWVIRHKTKLIVLLVLAVLIVGYSRFITGKIELDPELYNEENLEYIADNWQVLVDGGLARVDNAWGWRGEEAVLLACTTKIEGYEGDIYPYIYIWDEGVPDNEKLHTYAYYKRVGIRDAFAGRGRFGDCKTVIRYCGERCIFDGKWMGSDSSADALNAFMVKAIEMLDAAEQ